MSGTRKNVAILLEDNYERPFRLIDGILSLPGVRERCAFRKFSVYEVAKEDVFTNEWNPDGIITCYSDNSDHWLSDVDVPVVNMTGWPSGRHPSAGTDTSSMSRTAVEHFDSLGYKHILLIDTEGSVTKPTLEDSMLPLCESRNIKLTTAYMPDGLGAQDVPRLGKICPVFEETVSNRAEPLAIFSRHDLRGRLVTDYLVSKNIKIPQEVAVLGCFDSVDAKLCDPPLSSIVLRDIQTGSRGMAKLEKLMAGEKLVNQHEMVPVHGVRVRGSTLGQSEGDLEILRARSIIRERAREGITVDMLVSEINVSRSTFEKRFIALTGQSPAQEIRRVRLDWARELLLTTDLPMAQLAPLVGFMDRRAFVVFFKREAGVTPTDFRKNNRE
ncbi:XylR family transcriptional regulator [Oceaniferula spumae]|uniref:XylR family transcriptional regulator n=1 Tax=Oceaniferula spumae TaxID=2979115 RepID=A0AAT9FNF4_9BACT